MSLCEEHEQANMVDLSLLFSHIAPLIKPDLANRIPVQLNDVAAMLGGPTQIAISKIAALPNMFRAYLKKKPGIQPATIRNWMWRLNSVLRAAVKHDFIQAEWLNPAIDFPTFEKPIDVCDKRRQRAYLYFVKWCAGNGISYAAISDTMLRNYLIHLHDSLDKAAAGARYSDLRRFWNEKAKLGLLRFLTFPRVKDNKVTFRGIPYDNWPIQIRKEFLRFRNAATGNVESRAELWTQKLRSKTVDGYAKTIGKLLSYLMKIESVEIEKLSMRQLLENENWVLRFVEWHIRERTGGNERTGHQSILRQISSLLKGLYGSSDAANKYKFAQCSLDVAPAKDVFADLVFDYDRLIQAAKNALEEASVNWEAASKQKTRHGEALDMTSAAIQVRDALIFAFLIWRPMRAENITGMELDTNLAKTPDSEWRIMFDARLMKGRRPWAAKFPRKLAPHLEFYLAKVRPVLSGNGPDTNTGFGKVFISKTGIKLRISDLWRRITQIASKYLGAPASTHDFRRMVATGYLIKYPNDFFVMQQLLGHRFLETTVRYVREFSLEASRHAAEFTRKTCPHLTLIAEFKPAWKGLDKPQTRATNTALPEMEVEG